MVKRLVLMMSRRQKMITVSFQKLQVRQGILLFHTYEYIVHGFFTISILLYY